MSYGSGTAVSIILPMGYTLVSISPIYLLDKIVLYRLLLGYGYSISHW
jgi:hypothetical protein